MKLRSIVILLSVLRQDFASVRPAHVNFGFNHDFFRDDNLCLNSEYNTYMSIPNSSEIDLVVVATKSDKHNMYLTLFAFRI